MLHTMCTKLSEKLLLKNLCSIYTNRNPPRKTLTLLVSETMKDTIVLDRETAISQCSMTVTSKT